MAIGLIHLEFLMRLPPSSLISRLFQRMRGELIATLIRTFIARGIAALGTLLLGIVLGRSFGPQGVGVFALAQSVILGAGILACYGMDNALMRYVGQNPHSKHVKSYLRWACLKALWLSVLLAVMVLVARDRIALAFHAPKLASILVGIALAIPAFTLSLVLSGFMKGVSKPATACLLENGIVSFIAALLILVFQWVFPLAGLSSSGWSMALAAWGVFLQGAWQTRVWLGRQAVSEDSAPVSAQAFNETSLSFLTMSLAQFMQQVVSVLIAGALLASDELGLFKSAERFALLITFILLVINAVFPPRFAKLFYESRFEQLERLSRQGALLGLGLASPLLLVCLLFPGTVLQIFGNEFSQAANILRIIALGQLVNVATGSVGYLLNMTGNERLMRNIALLSNAMGLLLFVVLIPSLGALGAALALAFVLILQNITALYFVWKVLGIWTLPMPNILRWFGIEPHLHIK